MVTEDELARIQRRMVEAGITNVGTYMRKMALNGYILHVDLAPVKELVSLQRRCANNLNQVAVHASTFGVHPRGDCWPPTGLRKALGPGVRCAHGAVCTHLFFVSVGFGPNCPEG